MQASALCNAFAAVLNRVHKETPAPVLLLSISIVSGIAMGIYILIEAIIVGEGFRIASYTGR